MPNRPLYGRILPMKDGWLVCPICRRNKRLKRIREDEEADRISLLCRDCKNEVYVSIHHGQCFESRSQQDAR